MLAEARTLQLALVPPALRGIWHDKAVAIDVILAIWAGEPPYDIALPGNRFKVSTARSPSSGGAAQKREVTGDLKLGVHRLMIPID